MNTQTATYFVLAGDLGYIVFSNEVLKANSPFHILRSCFIRKFGCLCSFGLSIVSNKVQNILISYDTTSELIKFSAENEWACRASSFPQYLDSLLVGAAYPEECITPAVDLFSDFNVIYIEEVDIDTGIDFCLSLSQCLWTI